MRGRRNVNRNDCFPPPLVRSYDENKTNLSDHLDRRKLSFLIR